MSEDLAMPGLEVFPEYSTLPGLFRQEVRGLTELQLDRRRMDKGWGRWSIREQVSHAAWIPYLLFLGFWGKTLFGENLPRDPSLLKAGGAEGADRMLDPKKFHAMEDIFTAFEDSCALAREILEGETLGSLRKKILRRTVPPDRAWPTGESVRDYLENLVMPAHPGEMWKDEEDPDVFHQTLESTFRHYPWEAYVHLKTIQMHKRAEGLSPAKSFPEDEGYIPRLDWD